MSADTRAALGQLHPRTTQDRLFRDTLVDHDKVVDEVKSAKRAIAILLAPASIGGLIQVVRLVTGH